MKLIILKKLMRNKKNQKEMRLSKLIYDSKNKMDVYSDKKKE